jgi:hypothetical protein
VLQSKVFKIEWQKGVFSFKLKTIVMNLRDCRIEIFIIIPSSKILRPSRKSKEVDGSFDGTLFFASIYPNLMST